METAETIEGFRLLSWRSLIRWGIDMSARHGTKIQTKRNATNRRNWLRRVEHAVRELNRDKFFHYRNRGE